MMVCGGSEVGSLKMWKQNSDLQQPGEHISASSLEATPSGKQHAPPDMLQEAQIPLLFLQ